MTSWWWAHSARNMWRNIINLLQNKNLRIKLVIRLDYTEMHGQQNIKKGNYFHSSRLQLFGEVVNNFVSFPGNIEGPVTSYSTTRTISVRKQCNFAKWYTIRNVIQFKNDLSNCKIPLLRTLTIQHLVLLCYGHYKLWHKFPTISEELHLKKHAIFEINANIF